MADFTKSEVFFHNAGPLASPWPYAIAAAGRTCVSRRDGMVRRQYHEHTLILTVSGQGCIKVADGEFPCAKGDLAWLDTSKKYQHGAVEGQEWRYVWVGLSGYGLDHLHELIGLPKQPVIADMDHLRPSFDQIVRMLAERHSAAEAVTNASFAQIASDLFFKRRPRIVDSGSDPVSKVMRHLRDDLSRKWDISTLSDIAGLCPSQLFRRFKAVSGTTPKNWLRQERMVLARHLLVATSDDIASIALRCGYSDPFHFSRDFTRTNGLSPRQFRANARA
ncbi:helix-turn-helix domain-containing protein [Parasedimentitalea psychrophila]|uniref:AraC family transcriptional regulator n=1 Tax=Parasedimentitalea psychrophila TaxID=2997337 RepID=A0A9Y2KXK8_9RHOB|nr:AraC family transcriptional regulator [Parasedimentitalea psychrophila]WIY24995.1 AraC family transcriptional regulator [Parasedimentitalea psychrophila]